MSAPATPATAAPPAPAEGPPTTKPGPLARALRYRRHALAALALVDLYVARLVFVSWVPRAWLAGAALAFLAGVALLVKAVVFDAPPGSRVHVRRKEILLAIATLLITPMALAIPAAFINPGPTKAFLMQEAKQRQNEMKPSFTDGEIGWAPLAPPQIVGQHLARIDPAKEHIAMVGDSVWFGHGVDEPLIAAHLVDQHYEPKYQALNLSVSGWSPDQYYLYLKRTLPNMRPRLIVVAVFAGNDLQFTGREWNYGMAKPLLAMVDGKLSAVDMRSACIGKLSQSLLFRPLWFAKDFAVNLVRLVCDPREMTAGETEASVSAIFDAIEGLGREYHAPVMFMLLPVSEDWTYPVVEDRAKYTSKYKDLRRLLSGHALYEPYLDLAHARLSSSELYIDPGHYSPRGHRIVADGLIHYIDEHYHLLDAPPPPAPPPPTPPQTEAAPAPHP